MISPSKKRKYVDALKPLPVSDDSTSKRQMIVKEIFETEYNYISQLNTINNLFLKPIRVGCILPAEAVLIIFSNVEGILSVNQELFALMREKSLGEAFSHLGPFLKLYSTYTSNHFDALSAIEEWKKRSIDFAKFKAAQEAKPECNGLELSSLLIVPIQRIPRYKLLLDDLLKHTKPTHMEYDRLQTAAAHIENVANHINENIHKQENFRKMLSIQNSLTGLTSVPSIISPARRFIKEGKIMKVCRRKAKERMVFLFSDMLLYAKQNLLDRTETGTYESRCALPLLNSSVQLIFGDPRVRQVSTLIRVSNDDTVLLFFLLNQDELTPWLEALRNTIEELHKNVGSFKRPTSTSSHSEDELDGSTTLPLISTNAETGRINLPQDKFPETPYPLTATVISSGSIQDFRRLHKDVHTTHARTERKDVFDYSEETITRLTRRIKPKSLAFDDHVRVHQHSIDQDSDDDDENSIQPNESLIGIQSVHNSKCCIVM